MRRITRGFAALCCCLLLACAGTPKRDLAFERLSNTLQVLDADPSLGSLAAAERLQARQALNALLETPSRDRALQAGIAERRIEIAQAAAEAEHSRIQLDQLERERDRILLQASRRDAELSRLEAEKLRLQNLARVEETQRAQETAASAIALSELSSAEAEQARRVARAQAEEASLARQEADLASAATESLRLQLQSMTERSDARGQVMTLSGDAFASGRSELRPEARANLQRVVEFVQRGAGRPVLIEGHTDSQGGANANQVLSQRRAEAVRKALIEEGVDAGRLSAVGAGEDRPVDNNASAAGRARNRRVEIIIEGAGG